MERFSTLSGEQDGLDLKFYIPFNHPEKSAGDQQVIDWAFPGFNRIGYMDTNNPLFAVEISSRSRLLRGTLWSFLPNPYNFKQLGFAAIHQDGTETRLDKHFGVVSEAHANGRSFLLISTSFSGTFKFSQWLPEFDKNSQVLSLTYHLRNDLEETERVAFVENLKHLISSDGFLRVPVFDQEDRSYLEYPLKIQAPQADAKLGKYWITVKVQVAGKPEFHLAKDYLPSTKGSVSSKN